MCERLHYTIGWICALKSELTAARAFLDEEHKQPKDHVAQANDSNNYSFGSIGQHYIVLVSLPFGEYGTNNAASAVKDLLRSFTHVRLVLMVGIGGGAPLFDNGKKQDIRLGDVVVSTPTKKHGGILQYDYGECVQSRKFRPFGHMNQPPPFILTTIGLLESDFELEANGLDQDVSAALQKHHRLYQQYRRPDTATDRLYRSAFEHSQSQYSCAEICNSQAEIVERVARDTDELVLVHCGLVASGNSLIKDALLRDDWASKSGVLCFEMEAAGLANQSPSLAIRGICDYADTHKNKAWQKYAAMTAAAYARRLLLRLLPTEIYTHPKPKAAVIEPVEISPEPILKTPDTDAKSVQPYIAPSRSSVSPIEWLAAPDASINYNHALRSRLDGTGRWVVQESAFKKLLSDEYTSLWLYGIPGCGKTVLATTIIEHLRSHQVDHRHPVLYFYFDSQDTEKQGLDDMLRSLIKQRYHSSSKGSQHVKAMYDECLSGSDRPSTRMLKACLHRMCGNEAITIVLDALDECPTECGAREEVLWWLGEITEAESVRLIVTSRDIQDIRAALTRSHPRQAMLRIQGEHLDADIAQLVRKHVRDPHGRFRRWRHRPDIQQRITSSLLDEAGGMFRLVACQLDVLKDCTDMESLQKALHTLPEDLSPIYDQILRSIPSHRRHNAIRILQYLTYSERPLKLIEIRDILAVDPDRSPAFHKDHRLSQISDIISCCGSLTTLVTTDGIPDVHSGIEHKELKFAHKTVKDYLLSSKLPEPFHQELESSRAKALIAKNNLLYLREAWRTSSNTGQVSDFPLLEFASSYWLDYAQDVEAGGHSLSKWPRKLFTEEGFFDFWLQHDHSANRAELGHEPSRLYCAAFAGLVGTAETILNRGDQVNALGGPQGTALTIAASRGHEEMVQFLLRHNADPKVTTPDDKSALYAASSAGHVRIIEILLENGAQINAHTTLGTTALHAAVKGRHAKAVKSLIRHGATLDIRTNWAQDALNQAAMSGDTKIIDTLLSTSVAHGAYARYLGFPMLLASGRGHVDIVRLMLERIREAAQILEQNRKSAFELVNTQRSASPLGQQQEALLGLTEQRIAELEDLRDNALVTATRGGCTEVVGFLLKTASVTYSRDALTKAIDTAEQLEDRKDIAKLLRAARVRNAFVRRTDR